MGDFSEKTIWIMRFLCNASVLVGILVYPRNDIAYSLVFIWAFSGIAIKHQGSG